MSQQTRLQHLFGWMGTICLLAIIPIKVVRWAGGGTSDIVIGIAPSVLGPAGLLFLLLYTTHLIGWMWQQA